MSANGFGPFDNEEALDWVSDVLESGDVFDTVLASVTIDEDIDEVDATQGSVAVAAAALTAHVLMENDTDYLDVLNLSDTDLKTLTNFEVTPAMRHSAFVTLRVVRDGEVSELVDIWADAGELDEWLTEVSEIASVLAT